MRITAVMQLPLEKIADLRYNKVFRVYDILGAKGRKDNSLTQLERRSFDENRVYAC